MKKGFTVTVDENLIKEFKDICKEQDIKQSMLIEAFMRSYIQGKIQINLYLSNKNTVTIIED